MKKIFTIVSVCIAVFAGAQKIDPAAKKILDNVSSKLEQSTTFYIKFSYLYSVSGEKSASQTGHIYAAGEKYHLILGSTTQIFDGNKVYTISDDDKEITASDKADGKALSPTSILNLYKQGFNISPAGTKIIDKKKCTLIKLVPTDANKSKSIILAIANNKLTQVTENYNDGGSLVLTVKDFKENLIVNKSLLTFDKEKYNGYAYTEL
ncbi:MAG: outer membrane lipoprotein carrier protein LolA [Flavobacteriaceae bacterium]|jgi:outer membrane lipoprotein-sorting protein|nr:outer membrane lipoprotein carrier protein LolA [Flavobacteriaceae bacterium]